MAVCLAYCAPMYPSGWCRGAESDNSVNKVNYILYDFHSFFPPLKFLTFQTYFIYLFIYSFLNNDFKSSNHIMLDDRINSKEYERNDHSQI
jgi:hypothetical protein